MDSMCADEDPPQTIVLCSCQAESSKHFPNEEFVSIDLTVA